MKCFAFTLPLWLGCSTANVAVDAGLVPDSGVSLFPAADAGGLGDGGRDAGVMALPDASAPVDAGFERDDAGWVSLFNGKDFSGWQRYLVAEQPGGQPLGVDNDPRGVFTVVERDNEPAIRVSGEIWGVLASLATFSHFEFECEYARGTLLFPPLNFFDSGIMYFSVGPWGAVNAGGPALSMPIGSGAFLVSMEYQIANNDVGTMYNLGPISYQGTPRNPAPERSGWNQVRIESTPAGVRHFLNGALVASGSGFTLNWPGQGEGPLTSGKLQLQCEGAEIFFRRIRLKPLP